MKEKINMRKLLISIKNFVLVSVIFIVVFVIEGCSSVEKPSTTEDVKKYVNDKYSMESFKIIDRNNVDIDYYAGSQKKQVPGYKTILVSKDTKIEFEVIDTYQYRSGGFGAYYDLEDSYEITALKKYVKEFNNNFITYNFDDEIEVDINNFNSVKSCFETLYIFKNFIQSKKPFSYVDYYISVKITKNGELVNYANLKRDFMSEESFLELIK